MGNAKKKNQHTSRIWLRDSLSGVLTLPLRSVFDEKFSVSQCLPVSSVA